MAERSMLDEATDRFSSSVASRYIISAIGPMLMIIVSGFFFGPNAFASIVLNPINIILFAGCAFLAAVLGVAFIKWHSIKLKEKQTEYDIGRLQNAVTSVFVIGLTPALIAILLWVCLAIFKVDIKGVDYSYTIVILIAGTSFLTYFLHGFSCKLVALNFFGDQENDIFPLSEIDQKNDPWADKHRFEKWQLFSGFSHKTSPYFTTLTKYPPDYFPDKLKQDNYQRLAPFVEFLCAVHGRLAREALEQYTQQQDDKEQWPKAFFERYSFTGLKQTDIDHTPFEAVQTFLLGIFGNIYRITPEDLQLTPAEIRERIRVDLQEQHEDNTRRKQNGHAMDPVHERSPLHIQRLNFGKVLHEKSCTYRYEFENMVERLGRTYDREALSGMAFDGKHLVFGIPPEDERAKLYPARSAYDCAVNYGDPINRHVYIIGKTGSGKTTLLQTLIAQHIENEQGLVILSPENALFDKVLDAIPPERARDVVYFDPTAMESPLVSLSPFTIEPGELIFERMGEVYAVLEAALGELGDSMKALLNKCVYTLLQRPGSTLQDLNRLLKPAPDFRRAIIADTRIDEETREWWRDTYEGKGSKLPLSAEAILRRLDAFFMPPLSLTISRASFSLTDALNAQKSIFLFNLSRLKGLQAEVMGQLIISSVLQALLARDKQPSNSHLPYHFIIDEFQTYAGTSSKAFIDMFNRARKYRMSMTLAHQVTENIPQELLATIIGNAGTKIIMERPSTDAPFFAKELQLKVPEKETFNAPVLQNLQAHEFFIQTPSNKKGVILKTMFDLYEPIRLPIKAKELPKGYQDAAIEDLDDWRRLLKTISRQRYGKPIEAAPRAQPSPPSDHPNPKPSQAQDDPDEDDFAVT